MRQNARVENIALNKGISRNPSIGEAGELSTCVGLIPKGGELKPIEQPVDTGIFLPQPGEDSNYRLLAVHDVGTEKHYIVRWAETDTETSPPLRIKYVNLGWYNGEEGNAVTSILRRLLVVDGEDNNLKSIQITGNVLLLLWENGTKEYYIWRDGEYQSLGEGLPDIDVKLSLIGEVKASANKSSLNVVAGSSQSYGFQYIGSVSGTISNTYTFGNGGCNYTTENTNFTMAAGKTYRFTNNTNYSFNIVLGGMAIRGTESASVKAYGTVDITVINSAGYTTITFWSTSLAINTNLSVSVQEGTQTQSQYAIENSIENLNALKGLANSFITENMAAGKFVLPFFARVGIRMYDNSIVNLSEPILMLPATGCVPVALILETFSGARLYDIRAYGYSCDFFYWISGGDKSKLEAWGDLIRGIVISVSNPIYVYNEGYVFDENKLNINSKEISGEEITDSQHQVHKFLPGLTMVKSVSGIVRENQGVQTFDMGWRYLHEDLAEYLDVDGQSKYVQVMLPEFDDKKVYNNYTDKGQFYVLAEIPVDEIVTASTTIIDTTNKDLNGIPSWEQIEDGITRNKIMGDLTFDYNSRLHLASINEEVWKGNTPMLMQGYDGNHGYANSDEAKVRVITKIVTNGQEVYADSGIQSSVLTGESLYWYYYPDSNAVSALIYLRKRKSFAPVTYNYFKAEIPLKKHDFLNGAYWFESLNFIPWVKMPSSTAAEITAAEEEMNRTLADNSNNLYYPNRLYVSDAANPFIFRTSSSVTVGSGKILGLSVATQALSQGQFGQFPLYTFCSDGVWALEMSINGIYSAAKPLSRDVLTNPTSVTQLDDSVAFITEKGLMVISGSQVKCISEGIEGLATDDSFITSSLDEFEALLTNVQVEYLGTTDEFRTMMQTAKMIYDYPHKLLHVIPTTDDLPDDPHYVYSFESGQWGMQTFFDAGLLDVIPGYPETYMRFYNSFKLFAYRNTEVNTFQPCYALTRAIPFANPYTRKLLCDLRVIGQQTSSTTEKRRVAVYVSDDNVRWERLTSLNKRSAKYYRFLVMGYFRPVNSFSGLTAQVVDKYVNKLR